VKALFIGLGGIGQRHLRNLWAATNGNLDVIAYRIRRRTDVLTGQLTIDPGKNLETMYGLRVFDDLTKALAEHPDVAFICNPTSLHIPVALQAARAGCHLFLEKPVSDSMAGLDELLRVVDQKHLVTLVGYQLRFHPLMRRLRTLVAENAIGRIIAARVDVGEDLRRWHPYEDYREMYASRRDLGGGVILSQIHELDYLFSLLGLPETIYTVGGHLSDLEVDVEDVASILMQFRVAGRRVPVHVHEDYIQFPPSRSCQLIGSSGKILLDLRGLSLTHWDADGQIRESKTLDNFDRNQLFVDQTTHFLACLTGAEKPMVSLHDGIQSLRMALAAKESLATGGVVTLNG
jgi:predicted dehydrogenase